MPVVSVYDIEKNKVAEVSLSDAVFGADVNQDVIYEVVRMQMAAKRQGTHDTKGRSEIRGGGKLRGQRRKLCLQRQSGLNHRCQCVLAL